MKYSLFIIALSLPFVLWGVCGILPTFDDYTTLQSPQFTPLWSEGLLPGNGFWRPFDYAFGWLLGRFTWLFPWLNHVVIIVGHTLSTLLVYSICRRLSLGTMAANVATLFFFFSPATLGATLAVDGLNQTYAQFWGLAALTLYLRPTKLPWCVFFLLLAALSKENGLAWALVLPLVAFAFGMNDRKRTLRHVFYGLLFIVAYIVVRAMLNPHQTIGEEYLATTPLEHLKDFVQLLAYTWLPVDYASFVYAPARNWPLVVLTLLLALPFLALLLNNIIRSFSHSTNFSDDSSSPSPSRFLILLACYLLLAAPHLLTVTSIMHNYAPLSMAALLIATLCPSPSPINGGNSSLNGGNSAVSLSSLLSPLSSLTSPLFSLFLLAAIITDVHHCLAARASGQLSRQMAKEVIDSLPPTTNPDDANVFCISVSRDDDVKGYSSFYVRPVDAFAWGLSVRHYTDYQYPACLRDTTLTNPTPTELRHTVDSALIAGASSVWIVTDSCYHVSLVNKN